MSDDSDWRLPATSSSLADYRRKLDSDRRHDDLLRQQRRQHEEQLSAINKRSEREQAVAGRERSVVRTAQLQAEREQSLASEYQAKWQSLEADFADRVRAAAAPIRSKRNEEMKSRLKDFFVAANERFAERAAEQEHRREQLHNWHNELRSWQDRWNAYGGGPRDPERDDRRDEKAEHRADVESDVAAAMQELKH